MLSRSDTKVRQCGRSYRWLVPPTSTEYHRPDGTQADFALPFELSHSGGADQHQFADQYLTPVAGNLQAHQLTFSYTPDLSYGILGKIFVRFASQPVFRTFPIA